MEINMVQLCKILCKSQLMTLAWVTLNVLTVCFKSLSVCSCFQESSPRSAGRPREEADLNRLFCEGAAKHTQRSTRVSDRNICANQLESLHHIRFLPPSICRHLDNKSVRSSCFFPGYIIAGVYLPLPDTSLFLCLQSMASAWRGWPK